MCFIGVSLVFVALGDWVHLPRRVCGVHCFCRQEQLLTTFSVDSIWLCTSPACLVCGCMRGGNATGLVQFSSNLLDLRHCVSHVLLCVTCRLTLSVSHSQLAVLCGVCTMTQQTFALPLHALCVCPCVCVFVCLCVPSGPQTKTSWLP